MHLYTFREVVIVSNPDNKKIHGKLEDCGEECIYLGPSLDMPKDCVHLFKIQTQEVIHSRDVTWMGQVYGDYVGLQNDEIADEEEEAFVESDDEEIASDNTDSSNDATMMPP